EVRQRRLAATLGLREERTLRAVQNGLQRGAENLPETERVILEQALAASPLLGTFYAMRQELVALWGRSGAPREQLVKQLECWLEQAETSGVSALQQFSRKLYGFG
ncbi:transposase, partial [Thiocapsa sp.]|uniref:DesA/ISL3 alpha bundle tail domain-containing protein n=1 Tax=Thiocapsa sp. TaxID=2024551 RepID=UPI003594519E